MTCYNEGNLSEEQFNKLVDEAESNGFDWVVDLGDDPETGETINLLIIEDCVDEGEGDWASEREAYIRGEVKDNDFM